MKSPLLVFTTDFGLSDAYAGVMKGVALSINPNLRFIDLSHQILPQNVAQGSFLLGINHKYFPNHAIQVAVVDPGVGTDRRPILLTTPCGSFVAPDNGLLSGVISSYLTSVSAEAGLLELPSPLTAVHLTNEKYWRHPVSETFHAITHVPLSYTERQDRLDELRMYDRSLIVDHQNIRLASASK